MYLARTHVLRSAAPGSREGTFGVDRGVGHACCRSWGRLNARRIQRVRSRVPLERQGKKSMLHRQWPGTDQWVMLSSGGPYRGQRSRLSSLAHYFGVHHTSIVTHRPINLSSRSRLSSSRIYGQARVRAFAGPAMVILLRSSSSTLVWVWDSFDFVSSCSPTSTNDAQTETDARRQSLPFSSSACDADTRSNNGRIHSLLHNQNFPSQASL